jgi:peptidoglycan/xylan/chitin deacetylase (PgdA/CDA1 family)
MRCSQAAQPAKRERAQIVITMDLEMSREYPQRGMREWDYEKGNLDEPTKKYSVDAARLVSSYGGVIHCFCVGRVLEQADVSWLKEIADAGHPIGNHTYDHVNVLARLPQEIQYRFQRSPWLIRDKEVQQVIRENIAMTSAAMKERLGIEPNGFRTPGGFSHGLVGREDIQKMLLDLGFHWVSSLYPAHQTGQPKQEPSADVYADIVRAQHSAQPFIYPSGLAEIPMSPISDVTGFRSNYWKLDWFLEALTQAIQQVIVDGGVFDFLCHPSCMVIEDPEMKSFKRICELVQESEGRAELVGLDKVFAAL